MAATHPLRWHKACGANARTQGKTMAQLRNLKPIEWIIGVGIVAILAAILFAANL